MAQHETLSQKTGKDRDGAVVKSVVESLEDDSSASVNAMGQPVLLGTFKI